MRIKHCRLHWWQYVRKSVSVGINFFKFFFYLLCVLGYSRMGDANSDSCHSEISSRSSLVSNSSFDMAQDERRLRHSGGLGESHIGGSRLERRATTDPDQYSLG